MTDLTIGGQAATMTSTELLDLVNQARVDFGEAPVRRNDFVARCQDELQGDHYETFVVQNQNKTESVELRMSRDQCTWVLMRESKAVRRRVTEQLNRPMTQAEQLLANAQVLVNIERRQRQTEHQVAALAETVGDMDRAHPLLDSIPNGMESITAIRQRIGKQYGLPPRVIDAVVREMPHSPRPFAMVRSKHEELNARPFAVWAKAEISRVFERFARGCTFVTQHRAVHPDFGAGLERFQMRGSPEDMSSSAHIPSNQTREGQP